MELVVRAEVRPTESRERVLAALESVFPSLEFKKKGDSLEGRGEERSDLAAFGELLETQQIRNAARSFLMKKADGGSLTFEINKQAAAKGKVNFVDFEIALGPIRIEVKERGERGMEDLIEWLTEK